MPRPAASYYTVVDTAGWFRTKQLLLPIGHATLDPGAALRVDIPRDSSAATPSSRNPASRSCRTTTSGPSSTRMAPPAAPTTPSASVTHAAYDSRRHYSQPNWWRAQQAAPSVCGRSAHAAPARRGHATVAGPGAAPDREHVVAREADRRTGERGKADDVSPHLGGRAQPGDVLGIETGGERTHVGDSAEDENKRRREAERSSAGRVKPRLNAAGKGRGG
jgi:hypothetical protein